MIADAVRKNIIVSAKDVSFAYNGETALNDVNFEIAEKDFIWIVGPNGGGKTTLLKLIVGLLRPHRGQITVFGRPPGEELARIGYMTQHAELDFQFPVEVLDVVLMGRLGQKNLLGFYNRKDKQAAMNALSEVGLADLKNRPLASLSGGQKRRILIARALAGEPDLLLLDEPTANLDLIAEKELYELLKKLNEKLTIITVSHDPAFVSDFVKRVFCVNRQTHEHTTSEINGQFMGDLYKGVMRMVRHDCRVDDGESK